MKTLRIHLCGAPGCRRLTLFDLCAGHSGLAEFATVAKARGQLEQALARRVPIVSQTRPKDTND